MFCKPLLVIYVSQQENCYKKYNKSGYNYFQRIIHRCKQSKLSKIIKNDKAKSGVFSNFARRKTVSGEQVALEGLPKGVYFVKVYVNEQVHTRKMVVQ
ncbi:MAG: T9SS type A sorting domain-containing protein [Cytophagaceae bacterium]